MTATRKMRLLLVLLALLGGVNTDIGDEGRQIVLQSDVETIMVSTKLGPMEAQLQQMLAASRTAQRVTAERASNDLKDGSSGRHVKQIFAMLKINDRNINRAIAKRQDFMSIFSDDGHDKRALEIYWD